jgi:hypothetical protein
MNLGNISVANRDFTPLQSAVFEWLKARGNGTFELDDVIKHLYGDNLPPNARIRANAIVKGIKRRLEGTDCYIIRTSEIGRGHKAIYSFYCKEKPTDVG